MILPAHSIVVMYCLEVYVGSINILQIKKGKLDIAPLNHLPLLPSGPGGFDRSWSYKTYPLQIYNFFLNWEACDYFFLNKIIFLSHQTPILSYNTDNQYNFKLEIFINVIIKQ